MTVNEEEKMVINVDKKVRSGMEIIYQNIWNVEDHILELLKVCPCVFSKDMFDSLLLDFKVFDIQSGNFENMASQITNPVMTISEAIAMDLMMKKLSETMDRLVEYINTCNNMVELKQFNLPCANLLEKLDNHYAYDVVDYNDLQNSINYFHLVVKNCDTFDDDYNEQYGTLNVLKIYGFATKADAYKFIMKNKNLSMNNYVIRI